ncbi:MAG TPA: BadF/BadG/BcrA/BcrD ATPase family protein [Fimbriimonas sp.]|nr:BadF/BadG/BcrA/BcrD ATPase family protein [Fimbriimonas sp.]
MGVFVGLDCGGSSSRVMAVDEHGAILFQGQSGAANLLSTPESRLRRNLINATKGCPVPDYVCGCFAGLVNDSVRDKGLNILEDIFPNTDSFRAEPDYAAALYAAPDCDVCVIAGTGSLICSKVNGKIVKSGGKGYVLGDEGSGYQYGRDIVMTYLDSPEKISAHSKALLSETFGSLEASEIIAAVYRAPSPATILARLVKAIGYDAAHGHQYAIDSIATHSHAIAALIARHISTHHRQQSSVKLSLSGGVWKASILFREQLQSQLLRLLPDQNIELSRLQNPPLYGAVQLAREMNHVN